MAGFFATVLGVPYAPNSEPILFFLDGNVDPIPAASALVSFARAVFSVLVVPSADGETSARPLAVFIAREDS
jgi:hypothetical protein